MPLIRWAWDGSLSAIAPKSAKITTGIGSFYGRDLRCKTP
jgi:hypothetical protein